MQWWTRWQAARRVRSNPTYEPDARRAFFRDVFKIDASLAVEFDDLPEVAGDSAVQSNVVAIEVAAEDFFVMGAHSRLHVGGLEREMTNDFLGRPPPPDFFFQVRKGLREEEGRDVRKEKIVEPVAFVQAECLERRLIENKDRTGWHVP